MDKGAPSSLFVNDGSFMERFKQLQQGTDKGKDKKEAASFEESKPPKVITGASLPKPAIVKTTVEPKANDTRKTNQPPTGGKLAFSLKQKSKLVAPPVKLAADDDEDEKDAGKGSDDTPVKRQKLGQSAYEQSSNQVDVAPSSPSDPTVKKVADKLASFVAKHGRQFEHVTRQKNPGDTPFKFLFDESCADYKYYEYRLAEEERALSQSKESQTPRSDGINASAFKSPSGSQRPVNKQSSYQIPASALYDSAEDPRVSLSSVERTGSSNGPTSADPLAMMEFYMKKAAQEEKTRQPKQSKDEMPPPASLQAPPPKRGHHMGDYIPPEELEKFLAACNDAASQKAVREIADKTKIQSDNVGHKLLSKMGWKEGEGLGSSKNGISDPIMAGGVKKNNLGVGAHQPGEVTPDDDIYEQYKKRMMLGYKHRPNPLNNPRKAYY